VLPEAVTTKVESCVVRCQFVFESREKPAELTRSKAATLAFSLRAGCSPGLVAYFPMTRLLLMILHVIFSGFF
jgi:hypothetical protein